MKKIFLLVCFALVLFGCTPKSTDDQEIQIPLSNKFQSTEYGFSFTYPNGWDEVTRDLPDKWALVKASDTLLFTVANATLADLLALGKIQALQDIQGDSPLTQQQITMVEQVVGIAKFNERDWYTYAIDFSDKNVDTIVSGTICGNREVMLVLVSNKNNYEINRELYTSMLNSFSC